MSPLPLSGRAAIVTGSARRIGRRIALKLASLGADVLVNARSDCEAAQSVAHEICDMGRQAMVFVGDVGRPADASQMVAHAVGGFGRLDILVNNAAIRPSHDFETLPYEQWRQVVATILDGTFLCSQAAAPHLRKGGVGRIVSIGGITAHIGATSRPHVVAAKAAVAGLTRALSLELGENGVTVNCVAPGLVEDEADDPAHLAFRRNTTPPEKIPLRRIGHPQDVADVVSRLCTDDFAYVTGQTIHVNGGLFG